MYVLLHPGKKQHSHAGKSVDAGKDATDDGSRDQSHLTIEFSGRPLLPLRTGERATHCEHGAATMYHGPLERLVRQHASTFHSAGAHQFQPQDQLPSRP